MTTGVPVVALFLFNRSGFQSKLGCYCGYVRGVLGRCFIFVKQYGWSIIHVLKYWALDAFRFSIFQTKILQTKV